MTRSYHSMNAAHRTLLFLACHTLLALNVFSAEQEPPSAQHEQRALEMRIEALPDSKVIRITITNHAKEPRFLRVPLGLRSYRINLVSDDGHPLAMTPKGVKELTEPGIGSVRVVQLKTEVPWSYSIDLEPLFQFPTQGAVRCDVSRLIFFSDPDVQPSDKDWIAFPAVTFPSGQTPASPKAAVQAPAPTPANTPQVVLQATGSPAKPSSAKPAPPSEEPTSSTPWSVVAVLVVAALGLLWLLLRNRRQRS